MGKGGGRDRSIGSKKYRRLRFSRLRVCRVTSFRALASLRGSHDHAVHVESSGIRQVEDVSFGSYAGQRLVSVSPTLNERTNVE